MVLIANRVTLISPGTERMLVEFGRANLVEKARQQPDKVRQVVAKARTDGVAATVEAVTRKLDQPMGLGYCAAGIVIEVGAGVTGLAPGDAVVSNGKHAEIVAVPHRLTARIPDGVPMERAPFTVLGAIALQGIRLAAPTLGEDVVVSGLGVIGLLAAQLLRANGCRVLGIDPSEERCALARTFGIETLVLTESDPVPHAIAWTQGRGVDAVLLCAQTSSSDPVRQAAQMCRKRGRIVLVGVTGLELARADFYEKELTFQVSCSYGPGRYDKSFEDEGHDYPIGHVRWTEQRNFEAFLQLLADGRVQVDPLITRRAPSEEAALVYRDLGDRSQLGILLTWSAPAETTPSARTVTFGATTPAPRPGGRVSVLGAGNFASSVLLPALQEADASFRLIASSGGVTAAHEGRKFGFAAATSDSASVLRDPNTDAIVIATRHDSHAGYVCDALERGLSVYVEKPLAIDDTQLDAVEVALRRRPGPIVMVGFNRRFSPLVVAAMAALEGAPGPRAISILVNAGHIPAEHWIRDPLRGGGRLVGEGCHFLDLARHLAQSPAVEARLTAARDAAQRSLDDVWSLTLRHGNGSVSTIQYLSNGNKGYPKERILVLAGGRVVEIDNFLRLQTWGCPGRHDRRLLRQDKGQKAAVRAWLDAVRGGKAPPVPIAESVDSSRLTIAVAALLAKGGGTLAWGTDGRG
jgi:predicted dehydrogenase/threonine dehydrogenase-like Zn-dependent dehydrogenase